MYSCLITTKYGKKIITKRCEDTFRRPQINFYNGETDDEIFPPFPGDLDNPQYDPQPINTSSVALNNDLNTIVQKFSEHYHDAWASRKIENGWVYGEGWSDSQKTHPRLKPYNMLNDYVCNLIKFRDLPLPFPLTSVLCHCGSVLSAQIQLS